MLGSWSASAKRLTGSFNRDVKAKAEIPHFHVHQLRHKFACEWLEAGGSLPALQQILGHASIVTIQRYARLSDEAVFEEAKRLQNREVPGKDGLDEQTREAVSTVTPTG
jgi:integrase